MLPDRPWDPQADGDDDDEYELVDLHLVKAVARPHHTLIGAAERTNRWTLRVIFAGEIAHPGFTPFTSNKGNRFSSFDSLYCDN